jgi:hypothetical protein
MTSTYPQIPQDIQQEIYRISPKILEWMSAIEIWLCPPISSYHIDNWLEESENIAESDPFYLNEWPSWIIVQNILTLYESHFNNTFLHNISSSDNTLESQLIAKKIERVLKATQTAQRTDAWYEEHTNLLTGSEIGDLFESEATRQSLVWSKIVPKESRTHNSAQAVPYEYMGPFDWGHKFEPVVKMLLEWKYNIHIAELGRISHPTEPKLAASPDGIITMAHGQDNINSKMVGGLVEIKCPISRKPDGRIIPKYYHQIQLQLAVTELDECLFTEHVFISGYKKEFDLIQSGWVDAAKNGQPHGRIFIVESEEIISDDEVRVSHRYEYSPINNLTWEPILDRTREHIVETMPWALGSVSQQNIKKDIAWWNNAQPAIRKFWEEVENKRKDFASGKLSQPVSKRKQQQQQSQLATQDQICVIKLT